MSTGTGNQPPLTLNRRALERAKAEAGLSTSGLAAAAGLSLHYVYSVVGGYIPGPAARAKLAEVLRVREDVLWAPMRLAESA